MTIGFPEKLCFHDGDMEVGLLASHTPVGAIRRNDQKVARVVNDEQTYPFSVQARKSSGQCGTQRMASNFGSERLEETNSEEALGSLDPPPLPLTKGDSGQQISAVELTFELMFNIPTLPRHATIVAYTRSHCIL